MAELADAIVQSGRETLENAIRMVEASPQWRARVVYGDTGEGGAAARCELPTAHCPLPTARFPLRTAHCPIPGGVEDLQGSASAARHAQHHAWSTCPVPMLPGGSHAQGAPLRYFGTPRSVVAAQQPSCTLLVSYRARSPPHPSHSHLWVPLPRTRSSHVINPNSDFLPSKTSLPPSIQ